MKRKRRRFEIEPITQPLSDAFYVEIDGFFEDFEDDQSDSNIFLFGPFSIQDNKEMNDLLDLLEHSTKYTMESSKDAQKAFDEFFIQEYPKRKSNYEDYENETFQITGFRIKKIYNGVEYRVIVIEENKK